MEKHATRIKGKPAFWRASAFLVFSNGITNLVLLALGLILIRKFGADVHGRFVFFLSLIAVFRLLFDLGINTAIIRIIGRDETRKPKILGALMVLSVIPYLPILITIIFWPNWIVGENTQSFRYFSALLAVSVIQNFATSFFNGMLKMNLSMTTVLGFESIKISALIHLLAKHPPFSEFLVWWIFGQLAAASIVVFLILRQMGRMGWAIPDFQSLSIVLRLALPFWIPGIAIIVFPQILIILVNIRLSDAMTSYFAILYSWSAISVIVLHPISNVFFSWISNGNTTAAGMPSESLQAYFRVIGLVSLAFALTLWGAGSFILELYGEGFHKYAPVFGLLVLAHALEFPRFFSLPLLWGNAKGNVSFWIETARVLTGVLAVSAVMRLTEDLLGIAVCIAILSLLFSLYRLYDIRKRFGWNLFTPFLQIATGGLVGLALYFRLESDFAPLAAACTLLLLYAIGRRTIANRLLRTLPKP